MQIGPGDRFYHNHTSRQALVTYEIHASDALEIQVLDPDGSQVAGCRISTGRTEHHSFLVPSGGALASTCGAGECIWKYGSRWRLLADRARTLGPVYRQRLESRIPRGFLPAFYCFLLVWINFYVCKQAFTTEYTGRMNSIQGVWIAMARLGHGHWFTPSWWPYWYGGMPFEFTYAPMTPGLSALIAWMAHVSAARGFDIVTGIAYSIGPAALFLMAREVTGRDGWSFLAALVYALSAPSQLVFPDAHQQPFLHLRDDRRLYLMAVWDELPHQFAVAWVCLAMARLSRVLREPSFRNYVWAGLFVAIALLTSAFGATGLFIFTACLLVTRDKIAWRRDFVAMAICAAGGYLAMCPFLPPSLIAAIRGNGELFANTQWTRASTWTCLAVLAGAVTLWLVSRTWRPAYLRFFFLLTYLFLVIPAVYIQWDLHFLPEPARYLVELEVAMPLLVVFALALLVDRLPKRARVVLAILMLWPAYRQIVDHRRFSKGLIRGVDISRTIEYKIARWTEVNLPGWKVAAPGSIWPWMNTFSRVPQFSGGSYTTVLNRNLLRVEMSLPGGVNDVAPPVFWYKAFGVDAVIMPGTRSPEFWQPHEQGHKFDAMLPVVWDEEDTRIYTVPRPVRSLAHVVPATALVEKPSAGMADMAGAEKYVAALDSAAAPASFHWLDDNRARVHAAVGANDVVSVQVSYHPGWKAAVAGSRIAMSKDGLGLMVLHPPHAGEYDIDLVYDGGFESKACRAVSAATLLAALAALVYRRLRTARTRAA